MMRRRLFATLATTIALGLVAASAAPASAAEGDPDYLVAQTVSLGFVPGAVALNADGTVFVANTSSSRVAVLRDNGSGYTVSQSISIPVTLGETIRGLAVAPNGDVFVSEGTSTAIRVLHQTSGSYSLAYTLDAGASVFGMAFGSDGTLFTADYLGSTVRVLSPVIGTYEYTQTIPVPNAPRYLAVGPDGSIYVTHQSTADLTIIRHSASGYAAPSTLALGGAPYGVAVRSDGTPIVVRYDSSASTGSIISTTGSIPAVDHTFQLGAGAYGIASGSSSSLVVSHLNGTITVLRRKVMPALLSAPQLVVGKPTSYTFHASFGSGSYVWSVVSGTVLPDGLSLSSAGVLSGTPTTAGPYYIALGFADAADSGNSNSLGLSGYIAVLPTFTSADHLTVNAGTAISHAFAVTADPASLGVTFTVAAGSSLPAGLTLSPAGALSGTASGSGTFEVEATDQIGTRTQTFSLTVSPAPISPVDNPSTTQPTGTTPSSGTPIVVHSATATTDASSLAHTGAEPAPWVALASLLTAAGLALLIVGSKRRGSARRV